MKGTVNKPMDTTAIKSTLNNLFGTVQSIWNMGKIYHSCDISNGVAKGLAGLPINDGFRTTKPTIQPRRKIQSLIIKGSS